ncbi:hypothetical protein QZH41_019270, partial [Actinostola sp. cb2023]
NNNIHQAFLAIDRRPVIPQAQIISKMADHSWGLSYKQLQDNFVSNLNGTSLREISLAVSTAPLCVLLRSCIGAVLFGSMASWCSILSSRDTVGSWCKAFFILLLLDAVFWILTVTCRHYITPVSRRIANLTFVLWQMAYNIQLLSSFLLADLIVMVTMPQNIRTAGCEVCYSDGNALTREPIKQRFCACMIAAINRNQLAYFMAANLLTGLVNFSVNSVLHP